MAGNNTAATVIVLALFGATFGCVPVQDAGDRLNTLQQEPLEQVLSITIDTSGSFTDEWRGRAYPFFTQLIDSYYRGVLGSESRLLIGQLSTRGDTVFWEGTPREFKRDFPNEDRFLDTLDETRESRNSPVYRSITAAIENIESLPNVDSNTELTAVVLSDLENTCTVKKVQDEDIRQLCDTIKRFTDNGGNLALYYAPEEARREWSAGLSQEGIDLDRVWIDSNDSSRPTPPTLD